MPVVASPPASGAAALGAGTWSFAGVSLNQMPGAQVKFVSAGLHEPPEWRGSDVPMASFPGDRFVTKQHKGRRIALEVAIIPDPNNSVAMYNTLGLLAQVFSMPGLQPLQHNHPDGTVRTAQAQVVKWTPQGDPTGTAVTFKGVVDFYLPEPYFYTTNVVDSSRSVSISPTNFSITHPGTVRGWKVLFDILGPAANPQILNNTNGVSVQCLVSVAASQHLLIDSGLWTALNNGVNAIGSIRHSGAFPFMFLEPGVNNLSFTATGLSGASTLTTTFQPCWI